MIRNFSHIRKMMMMGGSFLLGLFAVAGCGGSGGGSSSAPVNPPVVATATPAAARIDHVVIVIQENRSFDNFFATFPGADGARYGKTHTGQKVALVRGPLVTLDLFHGHFAFLREYDKGKMDGFDTALFTTGQPAGTYPYRYVTPSDIAPYWTMAQQYVLADHMFQTQGSGSFTGHQDLIAGSTAINSTESLIDYPSAIPWGCDAPKDTVTQLLTTNHQYLHRGGPFPCFDYPTLRDALDAAKLSWKYYTPSLHLGSTGRIWNAFDAIRAVRYGSEWSKNVSSPNTNFFQDVKRGALPAVAWVIPDSNNSDHPGGGATGGPSWVASIVNAIGESQYWTSSAIVVVWDDWGGLYDHVPPAFADDRGGLGFRVPCLIVSPYARKGYVSHTQYEFASILRFIEDNWRLKRLNQNDRRSNSIIDAFDFTQPARHFKPIQAPLSQSFFERQPPSGLPVDNE
jgi:phospholipase C